MSQRRRSPSLRSLQERLALSDTELRKNLVLRVPQILSREFGACLNPSLSALQRDLVLTAHLHLSKLENALAALSSSDVTIFSFSYGVSVILHARAPRRAEIPGFAWPTAKKKTQNFSR